MCELVTAARRLRTYSVLSNSNHDEVVDCVNGIRFDAGVPSMSGFTRGLKRLVDLSDQIEQRWPEFLSLE
jgi:hypothetical protein